MESSSIPRVYGPTQSFCQSNRYLQTLQTCWQPKYYESQKKGMVHFLQLQREGNVPAHITPEDMSDWLVAQGKKTLREKLWRSALEEGNDLVKLAWELNTILKMRDMEHEALEDLLSVEPSCTCASLADTEPYINGLVQGALKTLSENVLKEPSHSLSSPELVVVEIIPRLLQAFWPYPSDGNSENIMFSLTLSEMAIGLATSVIEKLARALKDPAPQALFSRPIGVVIVESLHSRITSMFTPGLLRRKHFVSSVTDVVAAEIQGMFETPAATIPLDEVPVSSLAGDTAPQATKGVDVATQTEEEIAPAEAVPPTRETLIEERVKAESQGERNTLLAEVNANESLMDATVAESLEKMEVEKEAFSVQSDEAQIQIKPKRSILYRLWRAVCCCGSSQSTDD